MEPVEARLAEIEAGLAADRREAAQQARLEVKLYQTLLLFAIAAGVAAVLFLLMTRTQPVLRAQPLSAGNTFLPLAPPSPLPLPG